MLKINFLTRRDLTKNPAGDTIQVLKTKEYLEKIGVEVLLSSPPSLKGEVYHLFNINRAQDLLSQLSHIQKGRGKIILSPIYWTMEEYLSQEKPSLLRRWRRDISLRRELVQKAHHLLPNGRGELKVLIRDLGDESLKKRASIIPNGVDPFFFNPSPKPFIQRYGVKDFVLAVGRISRRKNQLALIKAMKRIPIPLVIIGPVNDPSYYRQCLAIEQEVLFLPHLSQEFLASAYGAARVHVLCSWFDTPGLVSLEAALAGCNIVTTRKGTAWEYFKDDAWYCQPQDLPSIRRAILDAYKSPKKAHLQRRILEDYTWDVVAKKTLKAYGELL